MFIDNTLSTGKFRMAYIITGLAAIGSFVCIYFKVSTVQTLCIIGSIFAAVHFLLLLLLNPSYFSIEDDNDPIVIKRFAAYPLFRGYQAFNVRKKQLYKYTITKSLFGLRKNLVVTVRGLNKQRELEEFTYPKFNISTLPKDDIVLLEKLLNKYINENIARMSPKK